MRVKMVMPDDFHLHAMKTEREILDIYPDAYRHLIPEWRKRLGVSKSFKVKQAEAIPQSFANYAKAHTCNDCRRHYGKSKGTILRWAKEMNVSFAKPFHFGSGKGAPPVNNIPDGIASRAQRHLQRIGPVYGEKGGYSVFGKWMSTEDMIALAERKGFIAWPALATTS